MNRNYTPPVYNTYQPPVQEKKRGGCTGCFLVSLIGCLGTLVVLVVLAGVGYYLFQRGDINSSTWRKLTGKMPGEINMTNLGDTLLSANLVQLDVEQSNLLNSDLQLQPFDIDSFTAEPGHYRLSLQFAAGQPLTCTLTLTSGDQMYFLATEQGVVVNSVKHPLADGEDPRLPYTPLCQQ